MGRQDAGRPGRCRQLLHRAQDRRSAANRHSRRQLRRLRHARRADEAPDLFACGVDIVGPSNILTLLGTIPPYWESEMQLFRDRVGDFKTDEGREVSHGSCAADARRQDHQAAVDWPGGERPARQAGGSRPDCPGDAGEKAAGDLRAPLGRRARLFYRPPNRLAFNAVEEAFLSRSSPAATSRSARIFPIRRLSPPAPTTCARPGRGAEEK